MGGRKVLQLFYEWLWSENRMCVCKTERGTVVPGGHALKRGKISAFPWMPSLFFFWFGRAFLRARNTSLCILGEMGSMMNYSMDVLSSQRDSF